MNCAMSASGGGGGCRHSLNIEFISIFKPLWNISFALNIPKITLVIYNVQENENHGKNSDDRRITNLQIFKISSHDLTLTQPGVSPA